MASKSDCYPYLVLISFTDNIVPTSGMRGTLDFTTNGLFNQLNCGLLACTAVVTELSYHKKTTIEADISFLSEEEWRQELAVLLHDIVDEEGNVKRLTDLKSDAGVAWQKVRISLSCLFG